jgi:hypothetical protein
MICSTDKIFEIKIFSKSYFFSKEQILLFSKRAFLQISETHQSFDVANSSGISEKFLVSCFHEIFLLFSTSEEIIVSQDNVREFYFFI